MYVVTEIICCDIGYATRPEFLSFGNKKQLKEAIKLFKKAYSCKCIKLKYYETHRQRKTSRKKISRAGKT